MRPAKITEQVLQDAADRGLTPSQLAREIDCKRVSVSNACRKFNIYLSLRHGTNRANATRPMPDEKDLPPIDDSHVDPAGCANLWRAVLMEHLALALTVGAFNGQTGYSNPHLQAQARAWFGTRDFHMVCALAGFDGDFILRGYRARLAEALHQEALHGQARAAGRRLPAWGPFIYEKRLA
jgi:hypothetical protein